MAELRNGKLCRDPSSDSCATANVKQVTLAGSHCDSRIDELLDKWEDLRDANLEFHLPELCRDCPELLCELRRRIARIENIEALLETGNCRSTSHEPYAEMPVQLGRYRLQYLIGKGGFGEVWKGVDPQLSRDVAIKVLRPEWHYLPVQVVKFMDEAKRVARLRHANIVAVHDVGQDGPLCYIVSDFIDGSDLAHRMLSRRFSPIESIRIVAKIATALQHAHASGVIHRDVKPQNVLLDKYCEPFITDFGIAVTEAELKQGKYEIAGTPAYMSPEQAGVIPTAVDARTDVYSLGVVLYELLVGRLPYEANTIALFRKAMRTERVHLPSLANSAVTRHLDDVCMQALAVDPAGRWSSCGEFAEKLLEVLNPPPPFQLRSASFGSRGLPASKAVEHKRLRTNLTIGRSISQIGVATAIFTFVMALAFRYSDYLLPPPRRMSESVDVVPRDNRHLADGAKNASLPAATGERNREAPSLAPSDTRGRAASDLPDVIHSPVSSAESSGLLPQTGIKGRRKSEGDRQKPITVFSSPNKPIASCRFSPDGHSVLTAAGKSVKLWSAASGKEILRLEHSAALAFFSKDDEITTMGETSVCVWNARSGMKLSEFKYGGCQRSAFASNAKLVAHFTVRSQSLSILDLTLRREVWRIPRLASEQYCVALSDDGTLAVVGERDGTVRVWSTISKTQMKEFHDHRNYAQTAAFSPNKKFLLTGGWDQKVFLYELSTDSITRTHAANLPFAATFSPKGNYYAVGESGGVSVWDSFTGSLVAQFRTGGQELIESLCFSHDGSRILSGGRDNLVRLWQVSSSQ